MKKEKGHFQRFIRHAFPLLLDKYPYFSRLEKRLGARLPKSSSLDIGVSPLCGKRLVVNFGHHPKPWAAGQFRVLVNVNDSLAVVDTGVDHPDDLYEFKSGYYSLSSEKGKERWWCLKKMEPDDEMYQYLTSEEGADLELDEDFIRSASNLVCEDIDDEFTEYWHPKSYESEEAYFTQATRDVSDYIRRRLLVPFGYES